VKRVLLALLLSACPTLPGIEDAGSDAGRPPAGPIVDLAAGSSHACATTDDGGVWCWGSLSGSGRPVPIAGIASPKQLALGLGSSCALLRDRTVKCWGAGDAGQLGNGATDDQDAPVAVSGLSDVLEIAAGDRHVCARKSDDSVWCWGDNRQGQLGDMSIDAQKTTPSSVGTFGATQLDLGSQHSCALRASGTVVCWGDNSYGQLGDGTLMQRNGPTPVLGVLSGSRVAAGGVASCLLRDDRGVSCWGRGATVPDELFPADAGIVELGLGGSQVCGRAKDAVLCGDAGVVSVPNAVQLAAGGAFTCARTDGGAVWCWGKNDVGQLGNGMQGSASAAPVRVEF
jgi:alpha-tubulin suppressor-like RCC1 family protein